MGLVHLGESEAGHLVAVKVIRAAVLDKDTRGRFVSEVDSLKVVYGPFIAAFVAADAHADQTWLPSSTSRDSTCVRTSLGTGR